MTGWNLNVFGRKRSLEYDSGDLYNMQPFALSDTEECWSRKKEMRDEFQRRMTYFMDY